ncbi:hypothetical protein EKL94_00760 [Stenotrophomonas maltophilia]|uniref:Uncharacterized protein n=2 Tax=Lysobacteraceae TaxID=32033 RepID=A0A431URL2_STEMA|nr:hypothetical protein EKL94_00760 [Stenotrophomonas maltophilia]
MRAAAVACHCRSHTLRFPPTVDTAMSMTALALATALSGLPDITWERERGEDAHQLMLCQIHRDELMQDDAKNDAYQRAKAVCDLLAREYRNKWDFDAQEALAASAVDLDELIRRGDLVEVPPTRRDRVYE